TRKAVPQHFLSLLDAFIEDRGQPIAKPAILTKWEYDHTVNLLNKITDKQPTSPTVIDLFVEQASRFAQEPAVFFGGQRLTYQLLDEKSNQLAHYLINNDVGPGQRIALYLKRSLELLIGIWGVLKAGAAYIPIAINYPRERVAYILADSDASVVLTSEKLEQIGDRPFIRLDADWPQIASFRVSPPSIVVSPDHLAYIMYTSGSTGKPKGVEITNRALANYITWARDTYVKTGKCSFPLYTSIAFDLTVTSIFVPLLSGGSVVIYQENDSGPDLALLEVIEDNMVDMVKLTPSHLALLRDKDLSSSGIQTLIVGGEDFKSQLALELVGAFDRKVRIYNEYGPTEATVGCIVHQLKQNDFSQTSVPIGTPIANVQAFVLDKSLNPVPPGVSGELYLAGTSLAEGYLNRLELTKEKFIPNPFKPGKQMYRTGDLVRLNPQDQLEYLGREDEQVKIGGIRVEQGEIESALASHPAVTQCVVDLQVRKKPLVEAEVINCIKCGLPSNYPSVDFDENDVCQLCRSFENYKQKAQQYFRNRKELKSIFDRAQARKKGPYDCLSLLSGGKDSTYALAQLVEMGFNVLAFTLDNGYISEQAKGNIRRVVKELGVDHVFGETEAMNAIFVDSLQRHCNVCNGCFKTIYTLSTKLAVDKGIPIIVTGLSRGQFFETRLTEELFQNEDVDFDGIDETILDARKAYHRTDDAVNQLLDVSIFEDDKVFEQVQFVDYYRYSDVSLDEMLAYLDARVPWVRPTDTGRSTNCLINQVGIYVHKKERCYSNYAFPYSWDVRVGHKNRDASLEEVNEEIDEKEVQRIMDEIGYQQLEGNTQQLVACYVGDSVVSQTELQQHLSEHLPAYMIPTQFQKIDEIPLTSNGKVDRRSLPEWDASRPDLNKTFEAPGSQIEEMLTEIWS
ncbi:MAG: amino acid adenylation domain-containing protein, partial [Cyclobacteriaceae bacterium]